MTTSFLKSAYISCISVLFLLISCKEGAKTAEAKLQSIDTVFESYYDFKKSANPIEATKAGFNSYNDTIANYISDNYQELLKQKYRSFLVELEAYDESMMSKEQWLSLRVMKWDCSIKLQGLENELVTMASPIYDLPSFELMPLLQIQSLHLYVAQLGSGASVQPFKTIEDYDNWLKRLQDYMTFLDTCIEKMEEGIAQKVVLPKTIVLKMIPQLQEFINAPIAKHLFMAPIRNFPENFSDSDRTEIELAYIEFLSQQLIPKYKELDSFLKEAYLPVARQTSGLSNLPNGKETYDYLIKLHTTTTMTADAIHELGKSEVQRILGEMEAVKNEIGFKGDLKAFFNHVRQRKDQMPFSKPEEVIANFNAIQKRMEPKLNEFFDIRPKAGFEVRRTEAFREASASAEYVPGSKDATRAGTFYIPIPIIKTYNKFADEALFLHEAIPGHHFQLSLQQENTKLPEFLHPESMGVFVEGWALYAESLGKELGLYEDPLQYFGMLSMEMHRAIRLVVDTGIHAKGWTREEAIQYSLENEAESKEGIIAEIERYMATPGQALSYKIGQLKIRELRTRAEYALGERFDIKEFHNQVLNSGSLALVLLEEKIDAWITSQSQQ
ncbi:DUF885 domain-containing protein [Maribacter algarum]|uniref:DUF885 domain-containing protein n=1 Tax=Maribacter algarum (ex Zhang et al. 2020) TaxID=2578118 RepID=A0A5S3PSR2_9FLAO|nr:DUF885 domain-containing protein [Maribacter algarum]TMM57970.1 DUF885 domain-containing protein [Maribacter algarum]